MVMCLAFGSVVLLILVLTAGFAIVRTAIPPYYIWGYWISPFAYALRSLVINEMTSPQWSQPVAPGSPLSIGVASLESFGFYTDPYWIWVGVAYIFGFISFCLALTVMAYAWYVLSLQWTPPSVYNQFSKMMQFWLLLDHNMSWY